MYDAKNLRNRQFVTPNGHKHFAIFLVRAGAPDALIAGPFQKAHWATARLKFLGGQTDSERAAEGKARSAAIKAAQVVATEQALDNVVKLPKKSLVQRVKGAVKRVVEAVTGQTEATA